MSESVTPIHQPSSGSLGIPATRRDLSGHVLGDYRVERLLGYGGMGEVYLAHQMSLDRPVALKILRPELLSNATYLARFEKEATSAAKLNHPNVVHIYNLGSFDGLRYIAMEYVQGTNLKEFLIKKGPPDLPLALAIMKQAGQAVAVAGELGLIHRDIKPENLLLTRKGQVKVADFGLCRSDGPGDMALTQEGVTLGTPMYMSPEQVRGQELDHRSDLYSLGVTFYHMLAGVPPFKGETPLALALKHVQETPADLSVHRPDLPPDLCHLVMRLMAKAPGDRFPTAAEMLRELARIRGTLQTASISMPVPDDLAAPAEVSAVPRPRRPIGERLAGLRPRRRHLAIALVLAAALGAMLGARGRTVNLLTASSPRPRGGPGLWMASWNEVPKRSTAQAQFHHALLGSPQSGRDAAWLAVPGYFPTDRDWTSKAYIQLARDLLRRGDAGRLQALAAELGSIDSVAARATARVAQAAAHALRGEGEEVLASFQGLNLDTRDPALNELSLEVVLRARERAGSRGPMVERLRKQEEQLNEALQLAPLMRLGAVAPGR
jgi:serine/threonine-protein kinase